MGVAQLLGEYWGPIGVVIGLMIGGLAFAVVTLWRRGNKQQDVTNKLQMDHQEAVQKIQANHNEQTQKLETNHREAIQKLQDKRLDDARDGYKEAKDLSDDLQKVVFEVTAAMHALKEANKTGMDAIRDLVVSCRARQE